MKKSITDAVHHVEEVNGRVDVLINNAAVYLDEKIPILNITTDLFWQTMRTNLYGPFSLCQKVIPLMQKNGYGRVVNITSGYGSVTHLSGSQVGAYKISKIALNAMTRLLANGVDGELIKINCVDPGWVRTQMGGELATKSVEEVIPGIIWAATLPADGPTGGFFRDRESQPW